MAYDDILTQELRAVPEPRSWRPEQPAQQPQPRLSISPSQDLLQWPAAPSAVRDPFEEKENFSWGLKVLTSVFESTEEAEPLCLDLSLDRLNSNSTDVDPLLADLDMSHSRAGCVHDRLKGLPPLASLPEPSESAVPEPEVATALSTSSPRSRLATAHSQSTDDNDADKHNASTDEEKTVSPSSSVGHSTQESRWGRVSSGRFQASNKAWKADASLDSPAGREGREEREAQIPHTKTEAFILNDRSGFEEQISALQRKDVDDKASENTRPSSPGDRTVYIVGIDSATSDEYVLIRLSQFGTIRKYQLCGDPNQPTRYGFFEYNTVKGASGCQSLDGRRMFTRPIRVSKAKDAIKGGRVVPEAHQLDLLRSAAVCAAQGIEAPATRTKEGTAFRRNRRVGGSSNNAGGANTGRKPQSDKEKMFGTMRRSPTEPSTSGEREQSAPQAGSRSASRFDIKPMWSRRK